MRVPILLALLLLVPVATMANAVDAARDHWSRGDSRAAGFLLKRWLDEQPDDPRAHLLLASVYLDFRQGQAAEQALQRALLAGADPAQTLPLLGRALLAQGAYDRVLAEINADATAAPGVRAELAGLRGDAQRALGNTAAARAEYERALALDAGQVDALAGQARLALADGQIDEARALLLTATAEQPTAARLWELLGEVALAQQDFTAAEQALIKAVIAARSKWLPRLKRALVRLELGKLDAAASDIEQVTAEFPDYPGLLLARGSLLVRQGKLADGLAALDAYRGYDPANPSAIYLSAIGEAQRGNSARAEELLRGYLADAPQSARAQQALAQVLLTRGDLAGAERLLRDALATRPAQPRLTAALAQTLDRQGRRGEAADLLLRLVELAPDQAEPRVAAADGLYRAGELDAALTQLEAALELDPRHRTAPLLKIRILLEQDQPARALALARQLAEARSSNASALTALGLAKLANGDADGARAAFQAALEADPDMPDAGLNLAKLELRRGDKARARALLQRVADATPGHVAATLALADLDAADGKPRARRQRLRQAIEQYPKETGFRLALARSLLRQGATQEADALIQSAPEWMRQAPEMLLLHGQVQAARGDLDQAVETFRTLQSRLPEQSAPQFLLAAVYAKQGNLDAAEQAFARGTRQNPRSAYLEPALAQIRQAQDDPDRALALLEPLVQGVEPEPRLVRIQVDLLLERRRYDRATRAMLALFSRYPDDFGVMRKLVTVLRAGGEHQRAEQVVSAWTAERPDDLPALIMLAQLHTELGRPEAAREVLDGLLTRESVGGFRPLVLNNLAWLLRDSDPERARGLAERALIGNPESPAIKDTLGTLLAEAGEIERALTLLEEAHLGAPANPTIAFHYAAALARADRTSDARVLLLDVVEKSFPEQDAARALLARLDG